MLENKFVPYILIQFSQSMYSLLHDRRLSLVVCFSQTKIWLLLLLTLVLQVDAFSSLKSNLLYSVDLVHRRLYSS